MGALLKLLSNLWRALARGDRAAYLAPAHSGERECFSVHRVSHIADDWLAGKHLQSGSADSHVCAILGHVSSIRESLPESTSM